MSQLQSKLSAEKIPAEQCDQRLNYKDNSISRRLPGVPVGACGCLVVRSVGHLGKKYSRFIRHMSLKSLKSPKKQKSLLSPGTH